MAEDDLRGEVLRLRDRYHKIRSDLLAMEFRMRHVEELWERFEPIIEDLRETDRIAEGVAKKLNETQAVRLSEGNYMLSRRQTWAGIAGVFVAAGALLADVLAQSGVIG